MSGEAWYMLHNIVSTLTTGTLVVVALYTHASVDVIVSLIGLVQGVAVAATLTYARTRTPDSGTGRGPTSPTGTLGGS